MTPVSPFLLQEHGFLRVQEARSEGKEAIRGFELQKQRAQCKVKRCIHHEEQQQTCSKARELSDHWATWTGVRESFERLGYNATEDVMQSKIEAEKIHIVGQVLLDAGQQEAGHIVDSVDDSSEDEDRVDEATEISDTDAEIKFEDCTEESFAREDDTGLNVISNSTRTAITSTSIKKTKSKGRMILITEWLALPKVKGKVDVFKHSREWRTYFQNVENLVKSDGGGKGTVDVP